ncbi:MAG TPA: acetylglutamate kinase [Bryobacterales bacterium]|nr:acetylglutamate kinase [Bryobacterales bacterium]
MKLLIKLGGTLLDDASIRGQLAAQIAGVAGQGHRVVVVHGGGKRLSRYLAERGIESRFVNGLRVTTPEILEGVVRVFAGEVNTELVGALESAGARAVGLTGADAGLTEASPLSPELGAVGRIERVRPALLDLLTGEGYVPVVACLGAGARGELYNVNADQMAVACAAAFGAARLIFLTDVEGALDGEKRLLRQLTAEQAMALVESGIATGGMEAKLRACSEAVRQGVPEVRIAAGSRPGVLEQLLAGEAAGTAVAAAAPVAAS